MGRIQASSCSGGACPALAAPCLCFDIPPSNSNFTCGQEVRLHASTCLEHLAEHACVHQPCRSEQCGHAITYPHTWVDCKVCFVA